MSFSAAQIPFILHLCVALRGKGGPFTSKDTILPNSPSFVDSSARVSSICGVVDVVLQGPFVNFQDTLMSVTGGTGFFAEARGVIRLHNLTPFKFFYTFHLRGVPELPKLLSGEIVNPTIEVTSHPDAAACKPGYTLPNYTH